MLGGVELEGNRRDNEAENVDGYELRPKRKGCGGRIPSETVRKLYPPRRSLLRISSYGIRIRGFVDDRAQE
jgi:hypothetical protein